MFTTRIMNRCFETSFCMIAISSHRVDCYLIFPDPTPKNTTLAFLEWGVKEKKEGVVSLSFSVSKVPRWTWFCYRGGMRCTFLTLYTPRSWKSQKQKKHFHRRCHYKNNHQK